MSRPWYETPPGLADEIRADLQAHYPTLHLFVEPGRPAEVRGTFPVRSPSGRELDRYQVSIELPDDYSRSLPVVREIGGRIPWKADFHVGSDGRACVMLPDDRWQCFPEGAPFRAFLDGPLHDFFLSQSLVALGEPWPFGEWRHGTEGIVQYYKELLGTDDLKTIARFLHVLGKLNLKLHLLCPCGSGEKIKRCCKSQVVELRRRIPPAIARKSLERLGAMGVPYTHPSAQ